MSILLVFLVKPVKDQEVRHNVWCYPDIEHWEAYPEFENTLFLNDLCEAVEHALVGKFSFRIFLHVHHSNFGVLEWE